MKKTKKVIIPHTNIDYDALSSAIAAKKLYPDAEIVLLGTKEKSMKNFFINTIIYSLGVKNEKDIQLNDIEELIIVDTSRADRIGIFSKLLEKDDVNVVVYDHHFEENNIKANKIYLEKTGACTTILVEKIKEKCIELDETEATILMIGIYEDTGNLTFNTTTERDYYAAAFLLKNGANLNVVRDILYHDITIEQINILKQFIDSEQSIRVKNNIVTIVSASYDDYIPEISIAVNRFKDMKNIPVVIALLRLGNKINIIARSSVPEIDVKKFAEQFGGGGHSSAASAVVKDKTLIQVYNEVVDYFQSLDGQKLLAKDIMTWPVKYITENQPIVEAELILNRYNINVLPVLNDNGELTGLITRLIVAKALYHRLNVKVKDLMIKEFYTVEPEDSFEKVKDIILKENQRLLPVVKNGELVGVITRTDILKTIYQIDSEKLERPTTIEEIKTKVFEKDLKNLIKNELPSEIVDKLEILGEIAQELGYNIYLVGGIVRDLFLRKQNFDVDLVVEGDGVVFAKKVKQKLEIVEKIKTYEKFKTAVIFFKDGLKFDIATARIEYYKKPGSLPVVEASSLKMDLYRRDFTINALAIEITKDKFGRLIDFFGGLKDLREKKIRVIHNLSFVEDPTRIFRAIRFAVRFGFEIGKQTHSLIKNAVSLKLLETVEGMRIFHELRLIFEEDKVIEIIEIMNSYNLLKFFSEKIKITDYEFNFLENINNYTKWYELTFPEEKSLKKWVLYLIGLFFKVLNKEINSISQKLNLFKKDADYLKRTYFEVHYILKELFRNKDIKNSEVYKLLKDKNIESLIIVLSYIDDKLLKKKIINFLIKLRYVKPEITGNDLIALGFKPSPLFKIILNHILEKKLNGELKSYDEEKEFVIKNYLPLIMKEEY